ncbi:unnamed protein product [Cladocopium goreaui]|uniref:Uncharacterized protein n=1 Tax=Cladocopium goreaui TaxID=2562237 RepID=A0A9P1D6Z9_9DINO|nr:unnamed protein product [Cladocopium goreaui]
MRSGIGLDCNVAYREIPICSGYDDEGNPIVELVEWPFVLPHQLVAAMIQNGFLNVLVQLDKMVDYWHHMLKEFPDHPAASMVSASAPLSLYGDEGQALGGSYMAFHFQSDLSPCLKNAGVSRFLITTIPSSYYVFAGKVNLTLQSAAKIICGSLNELSRNGVAIPGDVSDHAVKLRFYVMNFKGDWKYLVQLFNFRKNPSTEKVCWKCEATKGNTDMTNAYTDVAEHAPWKATLWTSLPWPISEVPELTKVTGFDVKMISADLLHTWHLGCGRDLAGSCIKVLVGLRYFHGRSIERSLAQATAQLKRFAKLHKHSLVLRKLTKANLNWSDYPELRCKGFDTFVVLAWLQHEFSLQSKLDLMTTAVWCMDSLMRMLAHSGMHLSEMQQRQKTILGSIYMNCYMTLAQKAIEDGKKLWRVRPKIHILHHCILEDRESRLNPHYSATWMDEDFVKRTMRVKKRTHKRTATSATLCRWLMGLPKQMQLSLDQL